jgi:ferredoxin
MEGQTQAAHSNWAEHGKGRGIKASDEFVAALCRTCHAELDQGQHLSKEQRRQMWDEAYRKTKQKLKDEGKWIE